MKRTIFAKISSFFLAVVMVLSGILSAAPVAVNAAGIVHEADANTVYDTDYSYAFKVTRYTEAIPWGFSDNTKVHDLIDPNRTQDKYVKALTKQADKGKFGMIYTNVGQYDGQMVDLKITITDWGMTQENWTTTDGEKVIPFVAFLTNVIQFQACAVEYIRTEFTFLKAGTNQELNGMKGHCTLTDLDGTQAFGFPNGCGVDAVYILKGNDHLSASGNKVTSRPDATTPADKKSWATALYGRNGFYLDFYTDENLKDNPNQVIGREESGRLAVSVFEFTAYALGSGFRPPEPSKRVGDRGSDWVSASIAKDEANAYVIPENGRGEYDYLIQQMLVPAELNSFVMTDTLESCLEYKDMRITSDEGDDVTDKFSISRKGQTVTASAKASALEKEAFTNNVTYTFHITVAVKEGADLKPYLAADGFRYHVPNVANVVLGYNNSDNQSNDTNKVWAGGQVLWTPIVNKTTEFEQKVGSLVPYTVTVTPRDSSTFGKDVVVTDISLPAGLQLQKNSLQVSGVEGAAIVAEGNGWKATCPTLAFGKTLTITFDALVTEEVNGQEITNVVTVAAANLDPDVPIEGDPDIDEWNNSPVLTLEKNVEKYEYRVGEQVNYSIVVKNSKPGTIAKKVIVEDVTLPAGLTLNGEVQVTGLPEVIQYPVQDSTSELRYEERQNVYAVDTADNKLTVSMDYLPADIPVTITFSCVVTDVLNGMEVLNTARAAAENSPEVKDDALIWVNSPVLKVVKTADKKEYAVGDVITYTLTGTQEQLGCVARNVIFEDTIKTSGVKLQKNSIVLMDENDQKIDAKVSVKGNHFILKTERNLVHPENYKLYNLLAAKEPQQQEVYNPLKLTTEKVMTVEYQVVITDEALAGQKIENLAVINSDENYPKEDEEEVPVKGPVLEITKTSDKPLYKVGETGIYTLQVRQIRDGMTAKDVVITDTKDNDGAEYVKDSIKVLKNGKELKSVKSTVKGNTFTIHTSTDMTFTDKLEVTYQVHFIKESLAGQKINNKATAKGSNTNETGDDHNVAVVPKDEAEKPVLEITKTSDTKTPKVGDTVHYTVTVKQIRDKTVAANVVIKDTFAWGIRQYVKIQKDSIAVKVDGKAIEGTQIKLEKEAIITVETGYYLAYGEVMTLEYDVKVEKATDRKIKNTAQATADNAKKVKTEHEITVEKKETPTPTTTPGANTNTPGSSGGSTTASSVKTGDTTPIALFAAVAVVGLLGAAAIICLKKKKHKK